MPTAPTSKPRFVGERQPLENRVEYVRGVTYKAAVDLHEELDDSSYILLRANNIQDGELKFDDVQYVDRAKVKPKQLLRRGDILLCASSGSKGLVGKAALVRESMLVTFGAFCCVLRPKENEAEYLGHFFQSRQYRRAIEKACSGSNINNLKAANFLSLAVPQYDDDSTRAISALFDSIDIQIKQAKAQIANLDSLVKSRFVEMFASGGFPTVSFGDVCLRVNNGITRRGNDPDGDIVLRLVELQEGFIDYAKPNRIRLTQKEKERFSLVDGDLLFARVNGNPKSVGRCASFSAINESVYHNDHVIRATFDHSKYNPEFLVFFMNSSKGRAQIKAAITTSAGQYTINQAGIKSIQVPLPPLTLQQEFATFVSQVDKSRFVRDHEMNFRCERFTLSWSTIA